MSDRTLFEVVLVARARVQVEAVDEAVAVAVAEGLTLLVEWEVENVWPVGEEAVAPTPAGQPVLLPELPIEVPQPASENL